MKLYISGPMTGYPDLNFPAFNKEALRLRMLGWEVINPVDINSDPSADWCDCICDDIRAVAAADCDGIALLPGWEKSPGAQIEVWTARKFNKPVFRASDICVSASVFEKYWNEAKGSARVRNAWIVQ